MEERGVEKLWGRGKVLSSEIEAVGLKQEQRRCERKSALLGGYQRLSHHPY